MWLVKRVMLTGCMLAISLSFIEHPCNAQDVSGVWRGSWTADATSRRPEHGGSLRVRLIKTSTNTYRGRFAGRFALVIPYFYRATVYQRGNQLYSKKRIGRRGSYEMLLQYRPGQLQGRWNVSNQAGSIRLRRR